MLPQFCFFISIAFAFIAWGIVAMRYIWPKLRLPCHGPKRCGLFSSCTASASSAWHSWCQASCRPICRLPSRIPPPTATSLQRYWRCCRSLSLPSRVGVVIAWIFNLWGSADLLDAFYQANNAGLVVGQLGATYFIPTLVVPLLLITHGLAFRILLQHRSESAMLGSRQLGEAAGRGYQVQGS